MALSGLARVVGADRKRWETQRERSDRVFRKFIFFSAERGGRQFTEG